MDSLTGQALVVRDQITAAVLKSGRAGAWSDRKRQSRFLTQKTVTVPNLDPGYGIQDGKTATTSTGLTIVLSVRTPSI